MNRRTPPLVPRMREHASTVFGEMSALAAETGSVNLGQGFPDTDGPEAVKESAIRAIREGRGNQYPPAHGVPELRLAIAEHQRRFYGIELDGMTDVVVATGASEAIAAALLALVETGDEVVMFSPWFDLYGAAVSLAGATRVEVPLTAPSFRPDAEALRAAITPRTRVLLLNTPHNPTGSVFTRDELLAIAGVVAEHDLWVISDEAYEHLVFTGSEHVPFSTLPGMAERTVTIGSAGKSLSMTGWKVGWATGPTDLVAAVRVTRQHLSFVSGGPFQWAVIDGLALPDSYWASFRDGLQHQRDLLCDGLAGMGFPVTVPEGTYFATTDVRPLGYADGWAFCRELPHRAGVVAIPHEVFHDDPEAGKPYVRWAFCKRPAVLEEALTRLRRAFG
ncbi:MAG TPA: pyridoxal phosphate-dependent aminotransferase [Candidatus Angelobacter sp.]|nr:pyridoxal phosphate-dependent aminotransferase [Candidatus Angelobacter sp.]